MLERHVCDECGEDLTNDEVDYWAGIVGYLDPDRACWTCEDCSRARAESQAPNV
jgi:hypothetical protein